VSSKANTAKKHSKIEILSSQPGPSINKNIYGQFSEHLGRGIYEGLWVGRESDIPNTKGWRNDVLEVLKEIKVPVLRWPGGCFADEYHWRNGIGPQEDRPVTVNTLWGGVEEPHSVGTHEFFDLVEILGCEAYVNGNMGTGTAQEMAEWLEYMTSDTRSDLAELRRKNGRDEPFRVDHFGIGNETWGAGGHMTPEYYTSLYKHWSTMLRTPWTAPPTKYVASGGHGADEIDITRWTEYLTANIKPNFLLGFDAVSFHYYTHPKGSVWEARGSAIDFEESEWISTLSNTLKIEGFIAANKAIMDRNDPENKIGFYIDEWGTWYDAEEGTNLAFLYQQNSLRDAVVAALNFNIFHKYADRVQMTNIAQMVNVLQAMVLTKDDQVLLTPTYYAYKMFAPFQGAESLAVNLADAGEYSLSEFSIPEISTSAARGVDGKIYLAIVNTNPHEEKSIAITLSGMDISGVNGQVLTGDSMDAHNTFESPNSIAPVSYSAAATATGVLELDVPAKSILVVAVETIN
jgi:alpha-N-arabinofuranosidase